MRRKKQVRSHVEVERHIEQLEEELGLADDGLVDLSTDPPGDVREMVPVSGPVPLVQLMNRLSEPPELRLLWEKDATGGLVAAPRPVSLVPMNIAASSAVSWPVDEHRLRLLGH